MWCGVLTQYEHSDDVNIKLSWVSVAMVILFENLFGFCTAEFWMIEHYKQLIGISIFLGVRSSCQREGGHGDGPPHC